MQDTEREEDIAPEKSYRQKASQTPGETSSKWFDDKVTNSCLIFEVSPFKGSHSSSRAESSILFYSKGHQVVAGCSESFSQHCWCPRCLLQQSVRAEKGLKQLSLCGTLIKYPPVCCTPCSSLWVHPDAINWLSDNITRCTKSSSREDLDGGIHHLNGVPWVIRGILDAHVCPQVKWALNCVFTKLFSWLFILLSPRGH